MGSAASSCGKPTAPASAPFRWRISTPGRPRRPPRPCSPRAADCISRQLTGSVPSRSGAPMERRVERPGFATLQAAQHSPHPPRWPTRTARSSFRQAMALRARSCGARMGRRDSRSRSRTSTRAPGPRRPRLSSSRRAASISRPMTEPTAASCGRSRIRRRLPSRGRIKPSMKESRSRFPDPARPTPTPMR